MHERLCYRLQEDILANIKMDVTRETRHHLNTVRVSTYGGSGRFGGVSEGRFSGPSFWRYLPNKTFQ